MVYAKPDSIHPPLNPHQFDYKSYPQKQGIQHQIRTNFPSIKKKRMFLKLYLDLLQTLGNSSCPN
ncbi:DUF4131 domain-containing protein [Flagellimonas halotolerans]|uniref:DUF4131 domain-containing protein n=1 Tax=Flagellimonas halotolerans TaxID=3112164 RepID=A0ABU6INN5_9FLAO|nr:DUF4131 domain-containing protein [Muricauda sp. SYSU M84420]MEC4264683.1 DUF4131 domain-containing protein [Muricauda sp. SYSU M84420]